MNLIKERGNNMKTINNINDSQYEESIIKEVKKGINGYSITKEDNWSLWIDDVGIVPKVGDSIRIYDEGIGRPFRGIVINDQIVFYRTKDEQENYSSELRKKQIENDKKKFEYRKHVLDYKYSKLPEVFRKRIDIFRKNNIDFRWKFEPYEIFCSEQALEIIKYLKTKENIIKFKELNYNEQRKLVPTLDDGHSVNTFSFSLLLARTYIEDEKLLNTQHGALCVLVGCKDYGCVYGN